MPLKSQLLTFLCRLPKANDPKWLRLFANLTEAGHLARHISTEQEPFIFLDELLEHLSEGKETLLSFLYSFRDSSDLIPLGYERRQELSQLISNMECLTEDEWEREFWGTSRTENKPYIPFVIPQRDLSNFTGREEQLQQLENLLFNAADSNLFKVVGICGIGGVGKSALASYFAENYRDKFPDGVIGLRVDGKDIDTIARDFARECREALEAEDDRDATTLMQDVFASRQMLLIFDNAEDANIRKLLPGGSQCAVIITTRKRNLQTSLNLSTEEFIDLPPLEEEEAILFLKKILGDKRVNAELKATKNILFLLGNLPLALRIIGGQLLQKRYKTITEVANLLEQEKDKLLEQNLSPRKRIFLSCLRKRSKFIYRKISPLIYKSPRNFFFEWLKVDDDPDLNVKLSLRLSEKSLSEHERIFLACLSVCAAKGFSLKTAQIATDCDSEQEAQFYLDKLCNLSLVSYAGFNRFALHSVIHTFAAELAQEGFLQEEAAERHANFFIQRIQEVELSKRSEARLFGQDIEDVVIAIKRVKNSRLSSYQLADKLNDYFEQYGYWHQAIELMETFQNLAKSKQDWEAVIIFSTRKAKYYSFLGNLSIATNILSDIQEHLGEIANTKARQRLKQSGSLGWGMSCKNKINLKRRNHF
jgi:GTPase SAR1 family protein